MGALQMEYTLQDNNLAKNVDDAASLRLPSAVRLGRFYGRRQDRRRDLPRVRDAAERDRVARARLSEEGRR
jgi:hypothetical protein